MDQGGHHVLQHAENPRTRLHLQGGMETEVVLSAQWEGKWRDSESVTNVGRVKIG